MILHCQIVIVRGFVSALQVNGFVRQKKNFKRERDKGRYMHLYRPVGLKELELIYDSGMREFPPRLPEQPIFYPVVNFEYASKNARDWNAKERSFVGYVTEFNVNDSYINGYETHTVGGNDLVEYWIPADDLHNFNRNVHGLIKVTEAYFGKDYTGYIPENFLLKNRNSYEQFLILSEMLKNNGMDFVIELGTNKKSIYLNFPFWYKSDFAQSSIETNQKIRILKSIIKIWRDNISPLKLPFENQVVSA